MCNIWTPHTRSQIFRDARPNNRRADSHAAYFEVRVMAHLLCQHFGTLRPRHRMYRRRSSFARQWCMPPHAIRGWWLCAAARKRSWSLKCPTPRSKWG
eukprot:6201418-Pleurochrysis_carterae.AAC.1